jgi:septum site-determining protein MinC
MTASSLQIEKEPCFQFKANFLPCTLLQIMRYDWEAFSRQLEMTIQRAPQFFMDLPVVIDLDKVRIAGILDFIKLKEILLANKMTAIGVRGGSPEQRTAAMMSGLPLLAATSKSSPADETVVTQTQKKKEEPVIRQTKLVTTPIRSGMQVYAKESDLIVTTTVSHGAELLADGNIHIYGALRGRVLAGVQGNMQARIFCRTLEEAELVSIAGYYLTKEDMQNSPGGDGMKQIYLENTQLRIEMI